nr:hypothetical protein [Pedobacter panaciterrae]
MKISHNKNNFIRVIPSHKIVPNNIIDLKVGRWYLAGITHDSIYVGNLYTPRKLLKVDSAVKDTISYRLNFPNGTKLTRSYFNLIEKGTVYTLDGNQPILLTCDISELSLKLATKPPYFTQAVNVNKRSFVFRIVQNGENKLVRYRTDSSGFKESPNLLRKQVDGIFSTDGNLVAEPKSGKVFYVYYYRNEFICADSNLKLIYQGKTIDTNSIAKLKVAKIQSQNQTTLAAPPIEVNKRVAVNENFLFVQSGLIADNEVPESLESVSTIDVYAIKDGEYQFSFYLPDFNRKKLTDFRVYGKNLYALFDHYLYKYRLNF